jgi:hypothetical protein
MIVQPLSLFAVLIFDRDQHAVLFLDDIGKARES